MCGGFVIGYTTKNAQQGHKGLKQHFVYGGAKVISYSVIGGIFGLIGGAFAFSVGLRAGVAIFAGLFMIAFAMSILGISFFRHFQFNPKLLDKWASKTTNNAKGFYKAPFMTGILSGLFIACGPLQALYLYAAGTGSFLGGFLSLGVFGIGTLPVLIGFGSLTSIISRKATKRILKITAVFVLILGLIMLNRGLVLSGGGYDITSIIEKIKGAEEISQNIIVDSGGYQVIEMKVDKNGWTPDRFVLKKGVPVKWKIYGNEITRCNNAIQVPKLGLKFNIKKGKQVIKFTPNKEGIISWSCWMGMIPGIFIVTSNGSVTDLQIEEANKKVAPSGSCGGRCGRGCGGSCGSPSCGR